MVGFFVVSIRLVVSNAGRTIQDKSHIPRYKAHKNSAMPLYTTNIPKHNCGHFRGVYSDFTTKTYSIIVNIPYYTIYRKIVNLQKNIQNGKITKIGQIVNINIVLDKYPIHSYIVKR